jgi:hypothetical protein
MEHFYSAVIPAKAGIQWLQELRDPRLRGAAMSVHFLGK